MKDNLYRGYSLLIKVCIDSMKSTVYDLIKGKSALNTKLRVQHIILNSIFLVVPFITMYIFHSMLAYTLSFFIAFVGLIMLILTREICDDMEQLILNNEKDE